jgi:exonuclease SbcC
VQLRSVRVRNFRSFENATLALGPGTTLLWGDVGAGKTSILYAIEMALFGFAEVEPTFLIRHRATTAEVGLTLSDGAHEYVFSRRFHRRVRRGRDVFELDEKGTGLSTDGHLTLYPSTELRQRAIDLLGFPDNPNPRAHSDLWRWAVYVPQERMRQILESDDAEARLETVRKALGLEKYRTAAENAQSVARELKREAAQRASEAELLLHWEADLDRSRKARDAGEAARNDAHRDVDRVRDAALEAEGEAARAEERRRHLEGDRREREELERRLASDRGTLADREHARTEAGRRAQAFEEEAVALERAAAGLPDVARRATEHAERRRGLTLELERAEDGRRELDVAEADRRSATESESQAQRALERGRSEREEAAARFERLRSEGPAHAPAIPTPRSIPVIEQALAEATTEAERLAGEVHHLEAALSDASTLIDRGVCPTCGQSVSADAFGAHRREVEAALGSARERHMAASARRQALSAERASRERYERAHDRWTEAETLRELGRSAVERADAEVARLAGELERLRSLRTAAQERAEELAPRARALVEARDRVRAAELEAERLDRTASELRQKAEAARGRREAAAGERRQSEELGREIALVRERITELSERAERLGSALAEATAVEAAAATATARRAQAQHHLEEAVGRLNRVEGDLENAVEQVRQAEAHVGERRAVLDEAARLREISAFLAGPFRDGLLELEHHLLSKAKADFDRSFGRYFALLIEDPALVARSDVRFSPTVEIDGETTPPEALSGGERTALALAFRLALGQIVRKVDRLRLDTLILDEPTDGFSPEQVQRMGELLGELGIPQVVLVSHEALLNGVADRVVRVRKEEGVSKLLEERGPTDGSPGAPAAPDAHPSAPVPR